MSSGLGQTIGREKELGELDALLARLDDGAPACVAIQGEPGIGKTRLLRELRVRGDEQGHLVLTGSVEEFERDVPFGVWVDALDAYVRRDTTLAQAVLDRDDELDTLKTLVFRELLTHMLRDQSTIEPSLDLILISRHLERIGDHATNVAEDVIFMVSAKDVRHHQEESDRPIQ